MCVCLDGRVKVRVKDQLVCEFCGFDDDDDDVAASTYKWLWM